MIGAPSAVLLPLRWSTMIAALAVVCASREVRGQPHEPSGAAATMAQSLFDRGRELMEAGKYSEACPLLEESHRLDPAGGTLLNLALCREHEGKLATAHTMFHEALSGAIRDRREDRKQIAQERIAAIAPRLTKVSIRVPPQARVIGLQIQLDGAPVPDPAWDSPMPVDGGPHRITARAPGRKTWSVIVHVKPSDDRREVAVIVLEPVEPFGAATPRPPAAACPAGHVLREGRCVAEARTRFSATTWVVGTASLAVLATASVTGALALAAESDQKDALTDDCMPERGYCRDEAIEDVLDAGARARTLGWVSTIALGVGSGGLVIAFLLPRERVAPEAQRPQVGLMPLPGGGAGVWVAGRW